MKRVLQRGPLVGYYIACPACGHAGSYLDEKCGYVETDPAEGTRWPRLLIGIQRPFACHFCAAVLSIEPGDGGSDLVARRAGT